MTRNMEGSSQGVSEKMESFRFTEDQETNSMIVEPVNGESGESRMRCTNGKRLD